MDALDQFALIAGKHADKHFSGLERLHRGKAFVEEGVDGGEVMAQCRALGHLKRLLSHERAHVFIETVAQLIEQVELVVARGVLIGFMVQLDH